MKENEIKAFIKQNAPLVYKYINEEILKDIGVLNPEFFVELVDKLLNKKDERRISLENITIDNFIYYSLVEVLGNARQAFTFYRKETLTLTEFYKEVRVYYNYVKFTIEENDFCVYLVQTKAGVTAFEEEIIKFTKKFPMKNSGLEEFINKNSDLELTDELKSIKNSITKIF